jgi:hypothetical protein
LAAAADNNNNSNNNNNNNNNNMESIIALIAEVGRWLGSGVNNNN